MDSERATTSAARLRAKLLFLLDLYIGHTKSEVLVQGRPTHRLRGEERHRMYSLKEDCAGAITFWKPLTQWIQLDRGSFPS